MYYVYILISKKDGQFYVGQTNDLSRRLWRHQQGYVRSTRHRRPLELLFYEEYETRSEAMKREKFLKSGAGHEYLKKKLAEAKRTSEDFSSGSSSELK